MLVPILTAKDFYEASWWRLLLRVRPVFRIRTSILLVRTRFFRRLCRASQGRLIFMATLPISVSIGSSLEVARTIVIVLIARALVQKFAPFCYHYAFNYDFHQVIKTISFLCMLVYELRICIF